MRHGQTQCLVQVSRSESENSASYAFPEFLTHQWWAEAPQWFWVYKLALIELAVYTLHYSELQTFYDIISRVISAAAKK